MKEKDLKTLFLKYQLALNNLKNKFDSLYLACSILEDNNPIEHLKYRIKKLDSIEEKLAKSGHSFSEGNIETYLKDVVGVRIVCPFLSDVKKIIKIIEEDKELTILSKKDYISFPKEVGYSSYHIIVEVPVYLDQKQIKVKAEIQVRTISMDMWASLEHKICYKKSIKLSEVMAQKLRNTAEISHMIDVDLNNVLANEKRKSKELSFVNNPNIFPPSVDLSQQMLKYEAALSIMEKKISYLSEEYERSGLTNPIEHIKGRIKSKERIIAKLEKYHQPLTIDNIENYINDIAGIRIVCSFLSDVEEIIQILKNDKTLVIMEEQDYITNPKESGYSSYHMLVRVPVHLNTGITFVKVEIQIRTMVMDMWAILEQRLCYQKEVEPSIKEELKRTSGVLRTIDLNMNETIKTAREQIEHPKIMKKKKKLNSPI